MKSNLAIPEKVARFAMTSSVTSCGGTKEVYQAKTDMVTMNPRVQTVGLLVVPSTSRAANYDVRALDHHHPRPRLHLHLHHHHHRPRPCPRPRLRLHLHLHHHHHHHHRPRPRPRPRPRLHLHLHHHHHHHHHRHRPRHRQAKTI